MCQSIANGGRRCASSMSGFSNYPHAVSVNSEGAWNHDSTALKTSGALMSHLFVVSARSEAELPDSLADLASSHTDLWESMSESEKWGFWKDITDLENPGNALVALHRGGWEALFPGLANIRDVPQSPTWHPEGAVHVHSQQAADVAARNATRHGLSREERQIAVLGALTHDFGKATHTQVHEDGRITSHGHNTSGAPVARRFLKQIHAPKSMVRSVPALVHEHMCHSNPNPSAKAVIELERRLEERGATFEQLMRVVEADTGGRGSASESGVSAKWLEKLHDTKAKRALRMERPVLNGDVLREMGLKPGPLFGRIIMAYNASGIALNREDAEAWVRTWLQKNGETGA